TAVARPNEVLPVFGDVACAPCTRFAKRFCQRYCRNRSASPARSLPRARRNSLAAAAVRVRPSCGFAPVGPELRPLAFTLPSVLSGVCCIDHSRLIAWQNPVGHDRQTNPFVQRLWPDMVATLRTPKFRLGLN